MAEAAEGTKKPKVEVTQVQMKDGRTVGFAGSRKMVKDYLVDAVAGTVEAVIDFRNGESVKLKVDSDLIDSKEGIPLLLRAAGHGLIQKLGDEAASEKDVDDAYLSVQDLAERLAQGGWSIEREAGGFSGASVVMLAILEAKQESSPGYTMDQVKAGLQAILDADKAKAEAENRKPMTRNALYASFRNPKSKVGQIVKRLEEEKAAKATSAVNADEALAALN